jgi:hypothetical protein
MSATLAERLWVARRRVVRGFTEFLRSPQA